MDGAENKAPFYWKKSWKLLSSNRKEWRSWMWIWKSRKQYWNRCLGREHICDRSPGVTSPSPKLPCLMETHGADAWAPVPSACLHQAPVSTAIYYSSCCANHLSAPPTSVLRLSWLFLYSFWDGFGVRVPFYVVCFASWLEQMFFFKCTSGCGL